MFFSEQGALVGELFLTSDNLGRVVVSPNAILRQAEHLRSKKIVLAHNHPSGLALPSKSDVMSTKYLLKYAFLRGVQIEEHFIVSNHSIYSMRRARIIS
jgi:DNA repair protein RadC